MCVKPERSAAAVSFELVVFFGDGEFAPFGLTG